MGTGKELVCYRLLRGWLEVAEGRCMGKEPKHGAAGEMCWRLWCETGTARERRPTGVGKPRDGVCIRSSCRRPLAVHGERGLLSSWSRLAQGPYG